MRIGLNPHKDQPITDAAFLHQVVMPVYIPHFEGYFEKSFEVLQLSLQSLFQTVHDKTCITIVNNGSCEAVVLYLNQLQKEGKIHEVVHTTNIGKVNAILKGLVGHDAELVTITDADVLFLEGWQQETYAVYTNFPKTGVVSIVPQIESYQYLSENVLFSSFFSRSLKRKPIQDIESLLRFYESIGRAYDCTPERISKNLIVENKVSKFQANVGAGHFVATYKRTIFVDLVGNVTFKLGGNTERYIDLLAYNKNLWRLTTMANLAYHMGNFPEPWMYDILQNQSINNKIDTLHFNPEFTTKKKYPFYTLLNFLIKRFFIKRIHSFVPKSKSDE